MRTALLMLLSISGWFGAVSPSVTAVQPKSYRGCYVMSSANWRFPGGEPYDLRDFGGRRPVEGQIALLDSARTSGGPGWAVKDVDSLFVSTNTVMSGWSIQARRTGDRITGSVRYFTDDGPLSLVADITLVAGPCQPAAMRFFAMGRRR